MPRWTKKVVRIEIEIRTTGKNEELAAGVGNYVKHGTFKDGLSTSLYEVLGDEFEILDGSTVEVEGEKPA